MGPGVLEKQEGVMDQRRDQRWVCGTGGWRDGSSLCHGSFCIGYGMVVHCNASRNCIMAVSKDVV
jgi:hypothetical protein